MRATGPPSLQIDVLGPAELLTPAREPLPLRQPLGRALAVRLSLARGKPVADSILIRDLWGDDDAARPLARLRVLASRLRGALGDHAGALQRTSAGFSLQAEPADLDAAERALSGLDAIRRSGDQARVFETTTAALSRWRGDPLSDLDGIPFVAAERQRLGSLRLELQLAWAESGLALGKFVEPELERLVCVHPLHERLVGLSAQALFRAGRQADALDRLHALRVRLADELGIDPAPETVSLEDDLRTRLTAAPKPRTSLPTAARTFVGREQEQAELLRQIQQPGLITLLGGPGVGKTRLARELAARTTESGRAVAWLDLAPAQPGDDLESALAGAAGATSGDHSIGHSAELLADALLVVDNAEHLVEQVATVIDVLRFKATGLSILVTSQRPLRLTDEQLHRVAALTAAEATQLFCDRSGAEPSAAVDRICTAVDRLPLGIELAAGLTRTLSVDQIAQRIEHRLRLLVRGLRDAGPRHVSLRSALDWSHELLGPQEQVALRRLAVFAAGCTPQAAAFVLTDSPSDGLGGGGIAAEQVDRLLAEFADRSLITSGDERIGLLETVREYALDQLRSSGEESALRHRHAAWCVELAKFGGAYGPQDQRLLLGEPELARLVRLEEPNMLAAIDWCMGDGNDPGRVSEFVAPLGWHWMSRGMMAQASEWLWASLPALAAGTAERGNALRGFAFQARSVGRYDEALQAGLECLEIQRALGDDRGLARTYHVLTLTSLGLDDVYAALDYAHQAGTMARALDLPIVLGASLNCSGLGLRMLGYPAAAKEMFEEAYDIWAAVRDDEGLVLASNHLGVLAVQAGDTIEGRRRALFCLRMARGIGGLLGILDGLALLATVEAAEGNYEDAVRLIAVVEYQREELSSPIQVADEASALAAAWATCREALGAEADRLAELSRRQSPETLTAEILAG
ncbi:ATP-binding protein [Kribbella albertanoniae]|uniref:ATP-binding protein n=1 Tax=Kribbella albertanoniae TaxID=1266829 RepID=UPI001404977B|nr:AfsR/SARP family transcriptional regulator [Kribbella albertanoniae]